MQPITDLRGASGPAHGWHRRVRGTLIHRAVNMNFHQGWVEGGDEPTMPVRRPQVSKGNSQA